jgi:LacI family transcriptional regulator
VRRPTISDLARSAGVSVATVDRVLNGRARVREETVRRVHQAAEDLGYHGVNAIRLRMLQGRLDFHVGIVLQKRRHDFYKEVLRIFEEEARSCVRRNIRITARFAETTQPAELADILSSLINRVDAVAATGVDHHEVTGAVSDLRAAGIPTFSLLSDFAQGIRESYFGTNNLKVGRTAGWLISRMAHRPGDVGLFIGGARFHGHELRETGFRSYFRDAGSGFTLLDTQINLETRQLTYEATIRLLERHPNLAGLYVAGGGMEGAISAIREACGPGVLVLIVNELTPESRKGLQDGVVTIVIGTPVRQIAADLIDLMVTTTERGMAETPGQRFFAPQIWTPESVL